MPEFRNRAVARERELLYILFGMRKWSLQCKGGETAKERLCPLVVITISWLGFFHIVNYRALVCYFLPFSPCRITTRRTTFSMWPTAMRASMASEHQPLRHAGEMDWWNGFGGEGGRWRGGKRMPEKRGRELEVNHMHNAITFHALIITIIF